MPGVAPSFRDWVNQLRFEQRQKQQHKISRKTPSVDSEIKSLKIPSPNDRLSDSTAGASLTENRLSVKLGCGSKPVLVRLTSFTGSTGTKRKSSFLQSIGAGQEEYCSFSEGPAPDYYPVIV